MCDAAGRGPRSYIPKERLGSTDDCGFSPFSIDEKPLHGSPDFARDVAFEKIAQPRGGHADGRGEARRGGSGPRIAEDGGTGAPRGPLFGPAGILIGERISVRFCPPRRHVLSSPYGQRRVRRPSGAQADGAQLSAGAVARAVVASDRLQGLRAARGTNQREGRADRRNGKRSRRARRAEIFDLHTLTVTDLYEESLSVARNVLAHLHDTGEIELSFHAGDLLSCVPPERRLSLVYENLPNIPAPAEIELRRGAIAGRFFEAGELTLPSSSRPTCSRSTTAPPTGLAARPARWRRLDGDRWAHAA